MLLSHGGSSRGISCLLFTRIVLVPNYRIIELFFFTRSIAEGHGVLSRDLSFGPTDQREVICELSIFFFTRRIAEVTVLLSRICELSNFSSHGESRRVTGGCHELSYFFLHTESHGESRRVSGFMSRIIELSNFFSHGRSRRFSLSQDMFLVTNLRVVEFLSSHGWLWGL